MKNGSAVVAILGVLAALAAAPAVAQDRGYYIGGTGGITMFNDTCTRATVPCDDEDTGVRIFGGYSWNKYAALEVGAVVLGEASGSGAPGSFTFETAGMDLSGVFSIPMTTNLSGFGRIGAYRVKSVLKQSGAAFGTITDSHVGSGFIYGAGLTYNLWRLGLRLEYLQYANVGSVNVGDETVEMLGLTVLFKFH